MDILQFSTREKQDLFQLNGLSFPEKFKIKKSLDNDYLKSLFYFMKNIENELKEKKPRIKIKKDCTYNSKFKIVTLFKLFK